jgi:hypothetical protein
LPNGSTDSRAIDIQIGHNLYIKGALYRIIYIMWKIFAYLVIKTTAMPLPSNFHFICGCFSNYLNKKILKGKGRLFVFPARDSVGLEDFLWISS